MGATAELGSSSRFRRPGLVLAIVCAAVFVVILDGTIVNVALPTISVRLDAGTRSLQWIVDAYLLAFTGLLLAAGHLGDRFGRRRALMFGLGVFAATSLMAAMARDVGVLVTARALMGAGAAFVFPATLAVITDVFREPSERARAVGVWGATSGIAVATGPVVGGWLLDHFWWGSVFLVNVPIALVAVAATALVVPESSDRTSPRLDLTGLAMSIAFVVALVYTIIEAPEWGWASMRTLGGFAVAGLLCACFVAVELRRDHPLLPVRIFRNLRFTAASLSVTAAFFALSGFVFLITQYFQLVRGFTPFGAGVRMLPVAAAIAVSAVSAPRIVHRVGTTKVVVGGLLAMAVAFLWISTAAVATPYGVIVGQMILLGAGLGFTTTPATESIMGSLPRARAGVGSAVNDTTRELGATLGVAVFGSVFSSVYVRALSAGPVYRALPASARAATRASVAATSSIAARLGALGHGYLGEVHTAFLHGLSIACLVAAVSAGAGALLAGRLLPPRATQGDLRDAAHERPALMVTSPRRSQDALRAAS